MLGLIVAAAIQSVASDPIVLRHGGPARVVTASETSDCGAVAFDLHYTATRQGVRGSLVARHGDKLVESTSIQSGLFANLSYVDSTVVVCDPDDRAHILISGVDRETGETDRLWQINFSPETGFDDPADISG